MLFRPLARFNRLGQYVLRATVGDVLPYLEGQILDGDGEQFDLTGITVTLRWQKLGAPSTSTRVATVTDADTGSIQVQWQAGDLDEPGVFRAWLELSTGNTIPSAGMLFSVEADH